MTDAENHDVELAQWLAEAALDLEANHGMQETLDETCQRAVAVIAGCRSAAINEARREHRGELLAASDQVARDLHDLQYELGDGPCIQAIWEERIISCDDLSEATRWPRFATAAVEHGVLSMMAIQLYTRTDTLGALNLFADRPGVFDEVTRDVAQVFAAHAAVAIADAREQAELSQALLTRQQIGQVIGILAERHKLTTDEAFTLLARTSQNHNIKIRDLAARIVASEDRARRQARGKDHA